MSQVEMIDSHVKKWLQKSLDAKSLDDIREITTAMKNYGKPIKYKLGHLHLIALVAISVAALLTYWVFANNGRNEYMQALGSFSYQMGISTLYLAFGLPIIAAIIAFIAWRTASKKDALITLLCDSLMDKATLLQYGIKRTSADSVTGVLGTFGEMQRGNYSRDIVDCFAGEYEGAEHTFKYEPYRLHYVEETTTQEYNHTEKRWETKTTYDHYDRSGIVLNFPFMKGVHICQGFETTLYPAPYKPASLEFEKAFHCRGEDEVVLARFLKPAVVETLTKAAKEIPSLTVEVNRDGKMCIGCKHHHIIITTQHVKGDANHDPRINPAGFHDLVNAQAEMPVLDRMLALAHTLMRYSDSNFSRKTA